MNEEYSHGTTCAALAAAGGNSVCSVGMAPDAKISSCRNLQTSEDPFIQDYLATFKHLYDPEITNLDVSSNSYGTDPCGYIGEEGRFRRSRQLQAACPFSPTAAGSPCLATSACAGADWSNSATLPEACEQEISSYCDVVL